MLPAQRRSAVTASMAAPIGGWNARDSLAEMNPLDAVELVNWFPTPSDLTLRKGYTKSSTGITGNVETVLNYQAPTGATRFAAAGTKIYNASVDPATEAVTGLSNARWQYVNMSTAGGDFIVACNGADPVHIYNGSYWYSVATSTTGQTISTQTRGGTGNLTATVVTSTAHGLVTGNQITMTGATPSEFNGTFRVTVTNSTTFTYTMASAPASDASPVGTYTVTAITGVNSNTFANVNLFKNRLYFVQEDTMKFWYLDAGSVTGAAAEFDLGGFTKEGGYLQAMGTWTIDAGEGVDDYAVFVTSMGEIPVYSGTDPTDPTAWTLKGIWNIGPTFTRRCFFKWSGDLLLLTQDGLVPMASTLQSSRLDPRVNLTDKIFWAVSQATSAYSANFGWQIHYLAKANMLILNIPTDDGKKQYVMHTITKAWAEFTNINAYCWEVSNEDIYFGSTGYVGKFWDGYSDAGTNIKGTVQQAYSYFESRGQLKRFTMIRPIFLTSNGVPTIAANVNIDFETQDVVGSVTFNPATVAAGKWDVGIWDSSLWGGGLVVNKIWQGVNGIGYSAGVYMKVASEDIEVHWASTDYVMERGGVI